MSAPAPSPASLCCCRKSSSGGGRCLGESAAAAAAAASSSYTTGWRRRPPADVASASNFVDFGLRHFHLDLRVNFALKEMSGWLVLDLLPLVAGARTLVLDAHPSLAVRAVDCESGGAREPACLAFRLEPFASFGSALQIDLPEALEVGTPLRVAVRYAATDGPAMWWLDSELTCGQDRPLVFTQGHSVSNRSFFPCFDSPAVKSTYTAAIRVPDDTTVVMSASRSRYSKAERVFHFSMDAPVPAYLVALVAGNLRHADVGPRSRVWAEPCLLSCAAKKLAGSVERLLTTAEGLFGQYLWGRCDLVFLPPAFPMVAMENPCLTFMAASILESGDFLLIDVVHEMAHAWFGNAVTHASWEEMWLSEGLATYAQRRITTRAYGAAFTCLESAVRLDALHRQLRLLGDNNPVTRLQVKLEPGFCFVSYLSSLCGDVGLFDGFLQVGVGLHQPLQVPERGGSGLPGLVPGDLSRSGAEGRCGFPALADGLRGAAAPAGPVGGGRLDPAGEGSVPRVERRPRKRHARGARTFGSGGLEHVPGGSVSGLHAGPGAAAARGDVANAHALRLAVGRPERGGPSALAAAGGPEPLLPRPAQTRRLPPKTHVSYVRGAAVRGPVGGRHARRGRGRVPADPASTSPRPAANAAANHGAGTTQRRRSATPAAARRRRRPLTRRRRVGLREADALASMLPAPAPRPRGLPAPRTKARPHQVAAVYSRALAAAIPSRASRLASVKPLLPTC
ncbi:aminopeptidase RNPEPL1 isoform X2 [Hippocampus comes]|uniref:aminopeptidase RNPEPL1 isoform X2 n=1 Tax=Hippocampus comes TaxID=109280 RepID=UPI00094E864F|nr:PREDICTED: arginyl aminopeptidase-like 1 isoform X2 [Hippocampus comes]